MKKLMLARKELVKNRSSLQWHEEKSSLSALTDPDNGSSILYPRRASARAFEGVELIVNIGRPLGDSSSDIYLSEDDARNWNSLDIGQASSKEVYALKQFGIFCWIVRYDREDPPSFAKIPNRAQIRELELAFWFDGPRTEAEIALHRERISALLMDDEERDVFGKDVAANLAPRSALSAEDRVLRDSRQALDWLRVHAVKLVEEAIPAPFVMGDPDNRDLMHAYFNVMCSADFAAYYVLYDVYATDCAVLTVGVDDGSIQGATVDVTDLIRHHKDDLFAEAAAALPDPGVPGYDRFLLIDLWRKGGGREQVLGEYPFWLKT